jgi:hypothetical protein
MRENSSAIEQDRAIAVSRLSRVGVGELSSAHLRNIRFPDVKEGH